jgi:hypothetical protein
MTSLKINQAIAFIDLDGTEFTGNAVINGVGSHYELRVEGGIVTLFKTTPYHKDQKWCPPDTSIYIGGKCTAIREPSQYYTLDIHPK